MTFTDILANYVIFLIITFGFISCIFTVSLIWFRFPSRSIDDVIGYLRPVDLETARSLMDPVRVYSLRIFPAPSLEGTRDSGGAEALESYDRLKTAASYLFLELKGERLEDLMQSL